MAVPEFKGLFRKAAMAGETTKPEYGLKKKDNTSGLKESARNSLKSSESELSQAKAEYEKALAKLESEPGSQMAQGLVNNWQGRLSSLQSKVDNHKKQLEMVESGRNADGSYIRPEYESLINKDTGMLDSAYTLGDKWNATELDSEGYNAFKKEALRDPGKASAWAEVMSQRADLNKQKNLDDISSQTNSAIQGSYDQLAAQGGLSGGARERIARGSLRDVLNARQNARREAQMEHLGIQTNDEQNRVNMLSQVPGMDLSRGQFAMQNQEQGLKAKEFDIRNAMGEMDSERADALDAWKKDMEVWGADKQSQAQARSSGGGGGCCFIFLEARYGNGAMDSVVRRFRNDYMTERNKRGYYKLSEVLVPFMRKSKLVKLAVRVFMTDPLVSYGKWHYGQGRVGWIFKPVKNFWMKTFDFLGQDHEFIRENGEVV